MVEQATMPLVRHILNNKIYYIITDGNLSVKEYLSARSYATVEDVICGTVITEKTLALRAVNYADPFFYYKNSGMDKSFLKYKLATDALEGD